MPKRMPRATQLYRRPGSGLRSGCVSPVSGVRDGMGEGRVAVGQHIEAMQGAITTGIEEAYIGHGYGDAQRQPCQCSCTKQTLYQ